MMAMQVPHMLCTASAADALYSLAFVSFFLSHEFVNNTSSLHFESDIE